MERKTTLDGQDLRAMFTAGAAWLEKIVPDINALNVYPVPDGDCGTNMLFTMRASLAESARLGDGNAAAVAQAIAQGALMGARGNSGVILSQMWRGLAQELRDKKVVTAGDLARALQEASQTAWHALSNPVEGTILTVMREAAAAAGEAAGNDASLIAVLAAAVNAARAAVMDTPNLLAVLKDAGVVDAGGHGLYTLLEGALLYLKGDMDNRSPELLSRRMPLITGPATAPHDDAAFGFCTQFMLRGRGMNVVKIRGALEKLGESVIVVGDASTIRVHIHTHDTAAVTGLAASYGTIFDVDIRNMDEQHQDFLLMNQGRMSSLPAAVVAVVNGDGLVNVFADLGVTGIVPGGQTMNPSTTDILRTVEEVPSDKIILLPNNKNVVPAACLAQQLTKKNLKVILTETIPQGIAALVTFLPEADFETNVAQMTAAMGTVRTIEITRATRSTRLNHLDIKQGQVIGLLDGELLAAGNTPEDIIFQLLARAGAAQSHIVTLYFGKDTAEAEAERISAGIRERYPGVEVGAVKSGQPNYNYIISVE
jgi:DAK2 domain fusion protein YloV